VGRSLVAALLARELSVEVLTRNPERARLPAGAVPVAWTPYETGPWAMRLSGARAVVHLAGEPVAQRWNEAVKARIRKSRVDSTRQIVQALSQAEQPPALFVCASAIGYYGDRPGDERLDEDASPGEDFLAEVVGAWEDAAREAEALGIRTVRLRIGIVLDRGGGALPEMMLPFKLFAGGPIGDGRQVVSWIHRADLVGLLLHLLDHPDASGPINAVAPGAVTSAELASALGAAMSRPCWLSVPKLAVRAKLGQAAEAVLSGQRVIPCRAAELGYEFLYPEIDGALRAILAES